MRWFLFALLLLVGMADSQEAGSNKAVAEKDHKAEQRKADADKRPELVKKLKAKSEKKTGKRADSNPDEKLNIDRQVAEYTRQLAVYTEDVSRFTLWLVIATIVIASIGMLQWWETRNTAKRQLRAYVGVRPSTLKIVTTWEWIFDITNYGQTPAYRLIDNAIVDICPYPLPPKFPFPELPAPEPSAAVIYPNMVYYTGVARAKRDFTQEELNKIKSGTTHRLYIFGMLKYVDIFGISRTTKFCYSAIKDPFVAVSQGAFPPCEPSDQHNEAD